MINNLFSIFDPSASYNSSNWLIALVPVLWIVTFYANNNIASKSAIEITINIVSLEINQLMGENSNNLSANFITHIFSLVAILNVVALLPFNFTVTAHVSITLSALLTAWVSTLVYSLNNSFNATITHLTPLGTPTPLINFIVIIEIVSNIIRPITLSVRLTANIVAGHLLVSLLSSFSISNVINLTVSTLPILSLSALEVIVAMVQAYVLTTLLTLYYNEA